MQKIIRDNVVATWYMRGLERRTWGLRSKEQERLVIRGKL
jgi:hypothetical protein